MGIGRALIVAGLVLVLLGILVNFSDRLPVKPGRLPGDFVFRGKNTVVYLPLATCLLASLVLSVVFWLISRR